jgi:hypothetical protein
MNYSYLGRGGIEILIFHKSSFPFNVDEYPISQIRVVPENGTFSSGHIMCQNVSFYALRHAHFWPFQVSICQTSISLM